MNMDERAIGEAAVNEIPQFWPDWHVLDIRRLAAYVSPAGLDDLSLPIPARYLSAGGSRGTETVGAVYDAIRSLGLRYSNEPFRAQPMADNDFVQRVRYPARMVRDSCGTCLDFALVYAAALMRAEVRPLIVITNRSEDGGDSRPEATAARGAESHVFVLADLRQPLQNLATEFPEPLRVASPGVLRMTGASGQFALGPLPLGFIAIDPTAAALGGLRGEAGQLLGAESSGDFALAVGQAEWFLRDSVRSRIEICDVAVVQGTPEGQPLRRPADSDTPAIWTHLPEMLAATAYASRADIQAEIMSARGQIVIHGPQGYGKSVLAVERARRADGGYGWFLNASDPASLQSELARVEIEQQARAFSPLDKLDRLPFSQAAVRRLEVSDAPWVLVLDNANGDPGALLPLLPRAPRPNQTIIVTTTNPEWSGAWPTALFRTLEPLAATDMPQVPDDVRPHLSGSPLFYEAARRAASAGAGTPATPAKDAELVELMVRQIIRDDADATDLAHLVAWSPAVPLPLAAFGEFCTADPAKVARRLAGAGLVQVLTRPQPSVLMHRLLAAQVRTSDRLVAGPGGQRLPVPAALLARPAGQDLFITRGDTVAFARLEKVLDRAAPPGLDTRLWGTAEYGIARAGELVGRSEQSARLFERAIAYLDPQADASLLSESWNGRARHVKDHPPADPRQRFLALAEALRWAEQAEGIARSAAQRDDNPWDVVRAERARAMRALVMKAQARDLPPADRKKMLAESLGILTDSEAARALILDGLGVGDSPDRDRAKFNLGGVSIDLAQMCSGAEAGGYLRQAHQAYEAAKVMRVARHGAGIALPSIAACDFGLALSYYYGALLSADPLRDEQADDVEISLPSRLALLRQAATCAWDALRDRTALSAADVDDDNALKSDDLMIKILDARKLVSAVSRAGAPLSAAAADAVLRSVEGQARSEALKLGRLLSAGPDEAPAEPG
jgi:hypothetical protein